MNTWICDGCGQQITNVGDGWVEWKNYIDGKKQSDGLRLVHHRRINRTCAYDENILYKVDRATIGDLDLSSFLFDDG